MSQWRKCPILERWVIIAPERAARPSDFHTVLEAGPTDQEGGPPAVDCPFCEGHEAATPGEVFALRDQGTQPDQSGWRVRVIPNKYPALSQPSADWDQSVAPCASVPDIGAHEVIVESPRHISQTTELTVSQLSEVLKVYRDRLAHYAQTTRLAYGLVFKNVGAEAGALEPGFLRCAR